VQVEASMNGWQQGWHGEHGEAKAVAGHPQKQEMCPGRHTRCPARR
jgi:hypothetical protein